MSLIRIIILELCGRRPVAALAVWGAMLAPAQVPARRPVRADDVLRLVEVSAPQCSPEGDRIAYSVSTVDVHEDKRVGAIWMVSRDGNTGLRMTTSVEGESEPRWSPDGKYLSFLSARPGKAKGQQIWAMDRRGGEAQQLTSVNGEISAYEWSPDAKRIAVVFKPSAEPAPESENPKPPKPRPILIDRYAFKRDGDGYLWGEKKRIYLFDIASRRFEPLNQEAYEEDSPAWSPDGTRVAFSSRRGEDDDRQASLDIWVSEAKPGGSPKRLTTFRGPDTEPVWSPDGRFIAYLQGSAPELDAYDMPRAALISVEGGESKLLTGSLDRGVGWVRFSADGRQILFVVADDRSAYLARVPASGGAVERLTAGRRVSSSLSVRGPCTAFLSETSNTPAEVWTVDNGALRKLTSHNGALVAELALGTAEEAEFSSKDGTEVHGLLLRPQGGKAGAKYPLLLRIHGGPNGQDQHEFNFDDQLLAARGYLVLRVNYRGSSGRGQNYGASIYADWGHKEVADLLAGVDAMVDRGLADPERVGVGGWSYGGILTNYLIASDGRFKAAVSGASSSLQTAMYGTDQYIRQYDLEMGPPWKNPEVWTKVSYPFYHADRIHTPTLFLGGDKDFNVPVLGVEQMYEALRSLGVPTELVIYPGEFHGIKRPSFVQDRLQRYLSWYEKHLPAEPAKAASPSR